MEHAIKLPETWQALTDTPKFGEVSGGNMWENNVLIAAFNPVGSNPLPASIDFAALKAAGIGAVLLRAGTSDNHLNPDEPSASCLADPNYKRWYLAATAAGLRVLIDYDVNAMIDSVNGYNGLWTLRHISNLVSGGFKPAQGGAMILNCERNTWTEGGDNHPVTCVSVKYGDDVSAIFGALWNQEHLVPGVRTGDWFLDQKDKLGGRIYDFVPWMDRGDAQIPLFMARWKKTNQTVTGDFHALLADIPDPATVDYTVYNPDGSIQRVYNEQAEYLYYGNKTRWRGWELATVKHSAVLTAAGTPALFRLILWRGNKADFDAYFNFPVTPIADTVPPSVPANLQATVSGSSVVVSWNPSTDNVGVLGYRVFVNGVQAASTGSNSAALTGLAAGTYLIEVDAGDAAGNRSAKATVSVTINGTTPQGDFIPRSEFEAFKAGLRAALQ
jgi:hypothetical protein